MSMRLISILAACCLMGGAVIAADAVVKTPSPPAMQPNLMDGVSQTAIQSAFQILRSEYIRSNELTFDELNRAALQGLLQRLDLGAELIPKSNAQTPSNLTGVLAELITPQIAYLRPLAYTEKEVGLIEERLKEYQQKKVAHLILDLRCAAPPGNFQVAASILDLFMPRSQVLFKMKQMGQTNADLFLSTRAPEWTKPVVVLVDEETGNLGETIAAVLQHGRQGLILGSATRGATVRYETLPVDDRWLLRFARAEMLLEDGTSLFMKGVKPNLVVPMPASVKREVFDSLQASSSVKGVITEQARLRYNEAALVARKNPEIETYLKRSAGEVIKSELPQVRDTVLQRAVDMLEANDHLQDFQMDWKMPPQRKTEAQEKPTGPLSPNKP